MNVKVTTLALAFLATAVLYSTLFAQNTASRSVWDGVYTKAQSDHGQGLYNDQCASCHGNTLEGGEMAPPLAGGGFLSNWNGLTVGDLFDRIRSTMPLNKPGSLSRDATADILAYILNFNQFPAGDKPMANQAEFLKDIRIDASKPDKK